MHFHKFGTILSFWFLILGLEAVTFEDDLTLNEKQKNILDVFKKRMVEALPHEYMKEDIYLIRWLRVRDFNLKAAETMLLENLKWREEEKMDTIQEEDWSKYSKDYKYWTEGRDKQGRPILYLELGTHDIRKQALSGQVDRYIRYTNKLFDDGCTIIRHLGEKYHNVTRGQLVVDLSGFSLIQHSCLPCITVWLCAFVNYEAHFPLMADQIILVNTPDAFIPLLQIIKPVLHPETSRAIKIYGRNRDLWKVEIAKDFDFNQLPPALGGTKLYSGMEDY